MSPRRGEPPSSSVEELVEGDDVDQRQLAEELADVLDLHLHDRGDLFLGRGALELRLEVGDGALELAGLHADRARDPVGAAQLVDDRAADARHGVALELDLAGGLEAGDRVDQAEGAVGDQVGLLHVRRQTAADPAGDVLDQRRVVQDQPIAEGGVPAGDVVVPQLGQQGVGVFSDLVEIVDGGLRHGRAPRCWYSVLRDGPAVGPARSWLASRPILPSVGRSFRPGDGPGHGPHGAARPSRGCRSGSSRG